MIYVHKPVLPDRAILNQYIDQIYDSNWLTNNGPLVKELEQKLSAFLGCKNVILVSSGTSALEVAIHAVAKEGEIITSPFSFAATSQAIEFTGRKPVFSDICPKTFNLDPQLIEQRINENTAAILPVHVYGNPCNLNKFADLSERFNIPVIYDAAHCFGIKTQNQSVFNFGSVSVTSLHATKLFHTIEGGAIFTNDDELASKIRKIINFGIQLDGTIKGPGTNAKMNEFEAAMGLALLPKINEIISLRGAIWKAYNKKLKEHFELQAWSPNTTQNFSYFPILCQTEKELLNIFKALEKEAILPRRYFYPTLNSIYNKPALKYSDYISRRIMCLPIFPTLDIKVVNKAADIILNTINR